MGPNGGARPGAGRKPTREKYAPKINAAEKRIADRLPQIIDRLFDLADGVTVQEMQSNGETRVYTRAPDFKAASYLVDRILGKPTAHVEAEVSGPQGTPIPVAFEQAVRSVYGGGDAGTDEGG